ncbi:hypothetical protein LKL81_11235 [Bacillus paranthracis]|uniref:hypothetical protein n=1 Tax=Bacillus TaxID=1386 RepID=UPI00027A0EE6|nr:MULTISPECIES: hypothetical protein [Bacillus]EJR13191.1 hypothetical protein II9_04448 [Bacillus cereus MSX-D12]KMP43469.1 hypothetical protein TU55_17660 [Bacillus cereus]KMP69674.1 hypothetical protein TU61_02440 [Bacillus cereus]MCC2427794.1 hypothetical protein [Bacillus paranthracis]MDC7739371.1 hypothetical protein [Bacillus sp. FF-1]
MELINRDASDKYKGFRYQKLRLAKKMLELIKVDRKANIIAIPEYRDDGYLIDKDGKPMLEQNKEYSSNFTLNSEEIQKSIVNFLDNYFDLDEDLHINYIFHTNVKYSRERKSNLLERLNLEPLEKPVLEYLIEYDLNDRVIEFVSKVIIECYQEQYSIDANDLKTYKGFYEKIINMDKEKWIKFLKRTTFQFGQDNLEKLTEELDKEIKECELYALEHVNKEQQIKSYLLEKIDERMAEKHLLQKIMNIDTVRIIFHEVGSRENNLKIDDLHKYWIEVAKELGDDKKIRNLRDKIEAVCDEFKKSTMIRYNREATTVREELKKYDKRQIYALRFRVYESMERYFDEIFKYKESYAFEELNSIINELKKKVIEDITTLKQDYDYGVKNDITVEKMVLLLIDECFYSFDEE